MDTINMDKDKCLELQELDLGSGFYDMDQDLEASKKFWRFLEQDCLAECCGINAFVFWPEEIRKAKTESRTDDLEAKLTTLKNTLLDRPENCLRSRLFNQSFHKSDFLKLMEHVIFCL